MGPLQGQPASVAVLQAGRGDQHERQQAGRVHHDVALAAVGLLPRIVPVRIRPTVSAPFTDWESTMPAVAAGSRPAASLTAARNASWIRSVVPSAAQRWKYQYCVPGREVVRHHPPRASGAVQIQDPVHDPPARMDRGPTAGLHRHHRLDQRPLFIGQDPGIGTRNRIVLHASMLAPPAAAVTGKHPMLSQHILRVGLDQACSVCCPRWRARMVPSWPAELRRNRLSTWIGVATCQLQWAHQPTEPSCFECLDRIADTHALETHAQLVCQPPGGFASFNGKGQSQPFCPHCYRPCPP